MSLRVVRASAFLQVLGFRNCRAVSREGGQDCKREATRRRRVGNPVKNVLENYREKREGTTRSDCVLPRKLRPNFLQPSKFCQNNAVQAPCTREGVVFCPSVRSLWALRLSGFGSFCGLNQSRIVPQLRDSWAASRILVRLSPYFASLW